MILVSPQEPYPIRNELLKRQAPIRLTQSIERLGADYVLETPHGDVGVQRKTSADLIASAGGRLADECRRLKDFYVALLLIEGEERWESSGTHPFRQNWNETGYRNLLVSAQEYGLIVDFSHTHVDTAERLIALQKYYSETEHAALITRSRLVPDVTDQEYFLMGLPGIGPKLAKVIYEAERRIPMAWTVPESWLCERIGEARGKRAYAFLAGAARPPTETE